MGLWQFVKESLKEGYEEAKAEQQQELERYQTIKQAPITLEKKAIAYACPFRKVLMQSHLGDQAPHLYQLGMLSEKEKAETKNLLERDFAIRGGETASKQTTIEELEVLLTEAQAPDYSLVLTSASIQLYILTATVDVDYLTWEEIKAEAARLVEMIENETDTHSWQQFADRFLAGEEQLGINNSLGRKLLKSRVQWLLTDEESPWKVVPWSAVEVDSSSQFSGKSGV